MYRPLFRLDISSHRVSTYPEGPKRLIFQSLVFSKNQEFVHHGGLDFCFLRIDWWIVHDFLRSTGIRAQFDNGRSPDSSSNRPQTSKIVKNLMNKHLWTTIFLSLWLPKVLGRFVWENKSAHRICCQPNRDFPKSGNLKNGEFSGPSCVSPQGGLQGAAPPPVFPGSRGGSAPGKYRVPQVGWWSVSNQTLTCVPFWNTLGGIRPPQPLKWLRQGILLANFDYSKTNVFLKN